MGLRALQAVVGQGRAQRDPVPTAAHLQRAPEIMGQAYLVPVRVHGAGSPVGMVEGVRSSRGVRDSNETMDL